jgi:hypothetical protein
MQSFVIFILPYRISGLFLVEIRTKIQPQFSAGMQEYGPLISGMVVNEYCLGRLVRETLLSMGHLAKSTRAATQTRPTRATLIASLSKHTTTQYIL